jgi:hypothetical protein
MVLLSAGPFSCTRLNPLYAESGESATSGGSAGAQTTTTTTTGSATLTGGRTEGDSGSGSSGAPAGQLIAFEATIAACTHDTVHDPAACEQKTGGELCVDQSDGVLDVGNVECRAHLRFDLGDGLAGATLLDASLAITGASESTNSGELWWLSDCFSLADLATGWPETRERVGEDLGAVVENTVVRWPVPLRVFEASTTEVCFSVVATSSDGVEYHGSGGTPDQRPTLTLRVD